MQRRELLRRMLCGAAAVPLLGRPAAAGEGVKGDGWEITAGGLRAKNVTVRLPDFGLTVRPDDNSPKARLDWDDPGLGVDHYVLHFYETGTECLPGVGYRDSRSGQITLRNTRTSGFVVDPRKRYTFFVTAVKYLGKGHMVLYSNTVTYLPGGEGPHGADATADANTVS